MILPRALVPCAVPWVTQIGMPTYGALAVVAREVWPGASDRSVWVGLERSRTLALLVRSVARPVSDAHPSLPTTRAVPLSLLTRY